MQMTKKKAVRLKGAKYKKLQKAVHERDQSKCRICGYYTQNPPHHIKFRSRGGSDTIENMVVLCGSMDYANQHFSKTGCHEKVHREEIRLSGTANNLKIKTIKGR